MIPGDMVRMELPSQPEFGKVGLILKRIFPKQDDDDCRFPDRITYHVLVDGKVIMDQLYEYMLEVNETR